MGCIPQQCLADEAAVLRAVDEATAWVLKNGWRNVVIEVINECDIAYDHPILQPDRVRELILWVQQARAADGHRLLVSTSFSGGKLPKADVAAAADFILLHGNGVKDPAQISSLVKQTRQLPGNVAKPILFNEDDHFDFDAPINNFTSAIGAYAGWGYFDYRMKGESFEDGYQSIPAYRAISSPRKTAFFKHLAEISGVNPHAAR
jgi:hypothetical protein